MSAEKRIARRLIGEYGTTYAEEAGIPLADKPSPLYRLLVLSTLLSARISASIAVAAARELAKAGMRTPRAMWKATWQERVDALGRGHYRRYDERTSTMLGDGAELLLGRWRGDLRRLHAEAAEDGGPVAEAVAGLLQEFPGIGPTGASIFCREVQGVWPDLAPYVDERAAEGAARLGLPKDPDKLAGYARTGEMPRLVAGCVRAALDKDLALEVLEKEKG